MAENPIAASTQQFLDGLDETVRETAAATVARRTTREEGVELSLEDELNVAKAIKLVAAADGFSRDEQGALRFLMIMEAIPNELQRHVLGFDVTGLELDDVGELFPLASRKAAFVLSGATMVAAVDGLSVEELAKARQLGERLGLEPTVVDALIANAWTTGLAMARGDQAVVDALHQVRHGLLRWVKEG